MGDGAGAVDMRRIAVPIQGPHQQQQVDRVAFPHLTFKTMP